MSKASLKAFFRTQLKVVAGGPPVGTPGANRTAGVLAALDKVVDEAVEVPTNLQRGGPFFVKFRSGTEQAAAGGAGYGAALFDIPGFLVCVGAEAFVEEDHDGGVVTAHVAYVAYFDERPAGSLGQFRGYLDGTFTPLPASHDGLVPLRWFKQGSQEAAVAVLRRYQSAITNWRLDETIKVAFTGDPADSFFTALQAGGPFPAPVKTQATAYWRPAAVPAATAGPLLASELNSDKQGFAGLSERAALLKLINEGPTTGGATTPPTAAKGYPATYTDTTPSAA